MKQVGASSRAGAAGFTIIEVMLFLAISGALVVALLATVGGAVSRQRFSDTINSTQAFLQSQVDETLNVVNTRGNASCSTGSGNTVLGSGSVQPGASNCVVLGRALDFTPGNSHVTMYPVVGHEPATPSTNTGYKLLADYKPTIDTDNAESYDIAWDEPVASIYSSGATNITRVLLLRSPDSGLVLTFGGNTTMLDTINAGTRAVNLCFKAGDLAGSEALVAVSQVSGSEGITTKFDIAPSDQTGQCV